MVACEDKRSKARRLWGRNCTAYEVLLMLSCYSDICHSAIAVEFTAKVLPSAMAPVSANAPKSYGPFLVAFDVQY